MTEKFDGHFAQVNHTAYVIQRLAAALVEAVNEDHAKSITIRVRTCGGAMVSCGTKEYAGPDIRGALEYMVEDLFPQPDLPSQDDLPEVQRLNRINEEAARIQKEIDDYIGGSQ